MKSLKPSTVVCYCLLALTFITSLTLRIAVPWNQVFGSSWVKFTDNDAYFYMRLLDNLAQHFPALGRIDPYFVFPGGISLSNVPFFYPRFMGFFTWLFGGGTPTQQLVDLVGVYFPAVAGALLVFPVFLIGRALFNRWAGLAAAGFIALMPGEFLIRTLLGNADSHAMEIFFTTLLMLFLVLAVQRGKTLEFPGCLHDHRRDLLLTLVFSALGGLGLGIYLLSWQGALLFVFIIFLWIVIQSAVDHLMGKPTFYLGLAGTVIFLIALLMALTSAPDAMARFSLATGMLVMAALAAISWMMRRRKLNQIYFPTVILILGAAALAALYAISPSSLQTMLETMSGFFTWKTGATTAEMQPLLIQQGSFTLALVWGNYTAASILGLIGFCYVVYRSVTKFEPGMLLLLLWSFIILISALAMRRFAYYLAINTAILAGYTCWLLLSACGLREEGLPAPVTVGGKKDRSRGKNSHQKKAAPAYNRAYLAAGLIAVLFMVVYPNTGPLPGGDRPFFDVASKALYTPPDGWCQATDWLRTKTPEPFGKADYYYASYETPPPGQSYEYPGSVYSVICWWDYGYWVTRLGHRVPFSNPGSAQRGEQYFYLAQDEYAAARLATNWGSRYIVVNDYLIDRQKGLPSICSAAGEPLNKYCEIYYRPQGNSLSATLLYYPEYYQTMAARLYCFDGKKYTPAETAAVSWETRTGADGKAYKEITGLKTYRSYDDALAFLNTQPAGNWRIVGKDPGASPVPLEELTLYRPAFSSPETVKTGNLETSRVKIFEYVRDAVPLAGDWNGDNKTEIGLWQPQTGYFLLDMNGDGRWNPDKGDLKLGPFGYPYDMPLVGDWSGKGKYNIGVWRPLDAFFYLDANGDGKWGEGDIKIRPFIVTNCIPVIGDWNGDGKDKAGMLSFTGGFLIDVKGTGNFNDRIPAAVIGSGGDLPVAGDWNGDGKSKLGAWQPEHGIFLLNYNRCDETIVRDGRWYFVYPTNIVQQGPLGKEYCTPVIGDWSGKGKSNVGVWNPHDRCFYLDTSGDGKWDEGDVKLGPFGE